MSNSHLPNIVKKATWLQTMQWAFSPVEFFESCAQDNRDIFTINLGFNNNPLVIVSHPQAIQEIFTKDSNILDSGNPESLKQDPKKRYDRYFIGGESIVNFTGEPHKQRRKLLMPPFHGERMRAYGETIHQITQELMNQQKVKSSFSVLSVTQAISFQVILKVVFGLKDDERYNQINQLLTKRLEQSRSTITTLFFLFSFLQKEWIPLNPAEKLKKGQRAIDELIYAEIDERNTHQHHYSDDMLSLMMSARDENGEGMLDVELRDELMTLLFAGHETTAISVAWALYWIHSSPEVKEKLLYELTSIGDEFDFEEINKLPYLDAVCKETLRIYPPAILAFSRRILSPTEIMGYKLEPGTSVSPSVYLTHHRQEIYPEPKVFQPERFLKHQFSNYEYLPFGGGNRICLGMAFAKFEMKLVLATILQKYQMELVNKKNVHPVRRGILIAPSNNLQMKWVK